MTVVRRLDSVLEPTKDAVLAMKQRLHVANITAQDAALRHAADQAFYYNTSAFTLHTRAEIRADIGALERETEGLLDEILVG